MKDKLTGAINMSIALLDHFQSKRIESDRSMSFQVIELPTKIKVEFKWLVQITKKDHHIYADEAFIVNTPIDYVKLDQQVEAVITRIIATELVDQSVDLNEGL